MVLLRKSLVIAVVSVAIATIAVWKLRQLKRSNLANQAASIRFLEEYCRGLSDELKSKYQIDFESDSCKAAHEDAGPGNFYVYVSRISLLTVVLTPSSVPSLESIHSVFLHIRRGPQQGIYRLK